MTRVYIAGPMSGLPQFNLPAFDEAAAQLRDEGYDVVSPAEMDDPTIRAISLASPDGNINTLESHGETWAQFLARDVALVAGGEFHALFVLPGWERSRGARLETFLARAMMGLYVYEYTSRDIVPARELLRAWAGGLWSEAMFDILKTRNYPR